MSRPGSFGYLTAWAGGGDGNDEQIRSAAAAAPAWVIAAAFVAVELAVNGRYGFMQDELYFVEASGHLAFGYVDQPPLTPLLTRVAELPGLSPPAICAAASDPDAPTAQPGTALTEGLSPAERHRTGGSATELAMRRRQP